MTFYIYTIHNILNNKIYVGKSKNPEKRWQKYLKIAHGKPKLTQEKADQIRELRQNGASLLELSSTFNVTKENISAIITNKIWRNK